MKVSVVQMTPLRIQLLETRNQVLLSSIGPRGVYGNIVSVKMKGLTVFICQVVNKPGEWSQIHVVLEVVVEKACDKFHSFNAVLGFWVPNLELKRQN